MEKYNVVLVVGNTHYYMYDEVDKELFVYDETCIDMTDFIGALTAEENEFIAVKTFKEQKICDYIRGTIIDKIYFKEIK